LTRGTNGAKFIALGCLITELWPFKVLKLQTAKILNGHSSVIKQPTAMNLAPLDSSRPFEPKIFQNLKKKIFANFAIAVGCLMTELWPFKILKFQTAITPLLSDLER
jgi:branched-subunit amino acid transport protein AzlD